MYMTQAETMTMWFIIIIGAILGLLVLWLIIMTAVRTAIRDVLSERGIGDVDDNRGKGKR